jgi:hypothetical protein
MDVSALPQPLLICWLGHGRVVPERAEEIVDRSANRRCIWSVLGDVSEAVNIMWITSCWEKEFLGKNDSYAAKWAVSEAF